MSNIVRSAMAHADDSARSIHSDTYRVDPPNWFVGMQNNLLQLLIQGQHIGNCRAELKATKDVKILDNKKLDSGNYLILYLEIKPDAHPQNFVIELRGEKSHFVIPYQLRKKQAQPLPINGSDVLYLIMPDRFANGNPNTDNIGGMREKMNRSDPNGRHGGDIQGIINQLHYIEQLGVTTLWLNPVYENNMKVCSYHGYSITDHYRVDPRLGDLEKYIELCSKAHDRGLKVIKDMIFNHIGLFHHWMADVPKADFINKGHQRVGANYNGAIVTDPHASEKDKDIMSIAWFDGTMPGLNLKNKDVRKYLTQHSLWWIEMTNLDGIRMDTYPYPDSFAMAEWVNEVIKEYPTLFIVGETWLNTPSQMAYWTNNNLNVDYKSKLPSISDFGIASAIDRAFREKKGMLELYQVVTNDFVFHTPNRNKIFVDNHDMNRSFTTLNAKVEDYLMAYTFLLTTRGIPQIFYGAEVGMEGEKPDGEIRKDMPGGWGGEKNVFESKGLSSTEVFILDYLKKLLNWRKSKRLFAYNNLIHFLPIEELYVYGRRQEDEAIVVILNYRDENVDLNFEHYQELFESFNKGFEILNDIEITTFENISIPAKSSYIIELQKTESDD